MYILPYLFPDFRFIFPDYNNVFFVIEVMAIQDFIMNCAHLTFIVRV